MRSIDRPPHLVLFSAHIGGGALDCDVDVVGQEAREYNRHR